MLLSVTCLTVPYYVVICDLYDYHITLLRICDLSDCTILCCYVSVTCLTVPYYVVTYL